jgi:hypothetical protein
MTFIPPIERSGEIKFYLIKSLPYYPRIYLILGMLVVGLGLQIYTLSVTPGLFFLLASVVLGLAAGYESMEKPKGSPFWKEVNWSALEEVIRINRHSATWDRTFLDITNGRGFMLFVLVLAQGFLVYFLLAFGPGQIMKGMVYLFDVVLMTGPRPPQSPYAAAGKIYLADTLVIALPLWFTGTRRLLKNDQLMIKVEELLYIRKGFDTVLNQNGDQCIPMMETRAAEEGEGEIPTDVQLKVRFKDMPKSYYGLQAQVNINDVQGRSYPYFYCVLVAEKSVNLWPFWEEVQIMRKSPRPGGRKAVFFGLIKLETPSERIVVEHQKQKDVEVLVVRQRTTKTSGYNVSRRMASEIFRTAYGLGTKINLSLIE